MNPDSQASLLALEKELERLRSAVEHIEQAKTVAQKVIGAVGLIQKKYAEHLDTLLEIQKDTVRDIGSAQQQRFDELSAGAKRHILESAARAKKYLEDYNADVIKVIDGAGETAGGSVRDVALKAGNIIQSAGSRMDELAGKAEKIIGDSGSRIGKMLQDAGQQVEDKIANAGAQAQSQISGTGAQLQSQLQEQLARVRDQINALNDSAAKVIQESGSSVARRIEEISGKAAAAVESLDTKAKNHVDEIGALARTNLREIMMQAKTSIEDGGTQTKRIFAAIKKSQEQQTNEFEKVTVSADALIAASGKLVRTIDAIDFPTRLQSIESDVRTLHFNLNSAMSRLDALAKSNEQAMAAFSDDVVAKLGRLEMFTDKSLRTHGDEMEKRLKEQEKQLGATRMILIIILLLNILIAAGTFMVWSGSSEQAAPTEQVVPVTPDTAVAPVEKPVEEKPGKSRKKR
ncbi:MAG: hypothetical protein WBQ23_10950 [Bacteroidota bacterium]